jgi:tetratricopeptide (TPR) repeat protein
MSRPEDTTARYAAALRALHEAAGAPDGGVLRRQAAAQVPPLKLAAASWSDWRNGRNVPANPRVARWLIAFLVERARQRSPGFTAPPPEWWERTRVQALLERREGAGRGGRPPRRDTASAWAVRRCRVGVIPPAADCFQRREAIDRLARAAKRGGVVLTGMGGIGKTQLAAAYARHVWQRQDVDVLVWVPATARPQIVAGYAQAAAMLGLGDQTGDSEDAAQRFLAWTQTAPVPWLLVLDDVQDPADVRGLWPFPQESAGQARMVVTTRRRDAVLSGQGRRRLDIAVFTPAEARAYLAAKLAAHAPRRAEPVEELDGLAADLGYLPLALAQAVSYLIDADLECAAYRRRLADRRRTLAEVMPDDSGLPDDHRTIVAAAWSLGIQRADQARPAGIARPLLTVAALLEPNGIPEPVMTSPPVLAHLAAQRGQAVSAEDAYDGLRALHRLSLIDHAPDTPHRAVRVHQLIQRAVRESLTPGARDALAVTVADALMSAWPNAATEPALTQALRACAGALDDHAGPALWRPGPHPVLFQAGRSLQEDGFGKAAIAYWGDLVADAVDRLGADHADTLRSRDSLAYSRGRAGDSAGAVAELEKLLGDCLRVLGPDHPETLAVRQNLAAQRSDTGNSAGAIAELEELLADSLRVLGPEHAEILAIRHRLAYAKGEAGTAAEAVEILEQVYEGRVRVLGPDHTQTLIALNHLAYWRGKSGDTDGACADLKRLLGDCLRVLGPDHPETLDTRGQLAWWRWEAGDRATAVAELELLLADSTRVLGADHRDTLVIRHNLNCLYGEAGDLDRALRGLRAVLRDRRGVLGPDHPDTLLTRYNHAVFCGRSGDAATATAELRALLADRVRVLGPDHPQVRETRHELALWTDAQAADSP